MKQLAYSAIIGAEAVVEEAADPSLLGIRGIIVREGKNTITLTNGRREVNLLKWNVTLRLRTSSGEVLVPGTRLSGRPEERTKEILRGYKR